MAIIGDTVMVLNVVYTVESNIVLFHSASVVTGFFLHIKHRCSEPHARMNEHASKRNQCVLQQCLLTLRTPHWHLIETRVDVRRLCMHLFGVIQTRSICIFTSELSILLVVYLTEQSNMKYHNID